ncbi:MAG: NAAT family transporter [Bdellovibrionaceae bacterium]|nr:NAAT family transporter [Pseudobdellovibrionaceae bacterium]
MSFFLLSFTSIFTLMNPFGLVPVFIAMTKDMEKNQIRRIATRTCFTAAICLIFFALSGNFLFSFFNISINSLRVVGGILFLIMGYDMLQARIARLKDHEPEEIISLGENAAITPLAIPMLSGPGTITAVIVIMKDAEGVLMQGNVILSIVLSCLLSFIILNLSRKITSLIGETGNKVFLRLMGLIVMMTAVEFFFAGVKPFVQNILK